jgi:cysteine desulfurase/selenocysteine lyase
MTEADRLAAFRQEFPAAAGGTYLNVAARSILSRSARAAMDALVDAHQGGASRKEEWDALADGTRRQFAALIGADAGEIAFTKNVAEGLNIIAAAFPWRPGDNVVLCPALEHPNNIYAWLNLRRRGVEVRTVSARGDAIDTAAMLAACDGRTRVLTVATVSFTPGFRTDVAALGRGCRERGIFLLVDAVQSTGVLHLDVEAAGIDGLATSTAKGLLGLYGFGFLFCRAAWIERLHPDYLARFSVDQGGGHESEMGGHDFRLARDARRFEVGHHNWPAIAAAEASLRQLLALGTRCIEAHATALSALLADGLAGLGLPVCRPSDPLPASHIVTVGRLGHGGAYATDDDRLNAAARQLEQGGVRFSVRRGLLRFATHAYNTEDDIARVLTLAEAALPRAAAA